MKVLLFSDLHTSIASAEAIVQKARHVDIVVGAGDFANARQNLSTCIDILKRIDQPTILIAGNNETTEELRDACHAWPSVHILQGSSVTIDGITFFGVGGGIPITPFGDWSYDFSEEHAMQLLTHCPINSVLITHSPPKGAVDVSSSGISLGSTAVRDAIIRTSPKLAVCGHIHASGGKQGRIGTTSVVNAGPQGIEWVL